MSEHERIGRLIEAIERETVGKGGWLDIYTASPGSWLVGWGLSALPGSGSYRTERARPLLAALTEAAERLGIEVAE